MSLPEFQHQPLRLVEPTFDARLTDLIIELEHLRKKKLNGSTHPRVFFQLKNLFHSLESIGSARIEGNNTTVAEYIETKLDQKKFIPPNIKEILNIEETMTFIEKSISDSQINRAFVSEIHKKCVQTLEPPPRGEGDLTPGKYRYKNVKISNSQHIPPDHIAVDQYMSELFTFINEESNPKYDLLKTAIAHHRFVWIHPFLNGNGRTVRLFTYAMLLKLGFNVGVGRILNPTAIFCNDRNIYYHYLSLADQGTNNGLLNWCEYVLKGLKIEIEKIDKLLDYSYLQKEILNPTLIHALERQYITENESKVLRRVLEKQVIQASDLTDIFPDKQKSEISRQIRKLIEKKMLIPEAEGKRKYVVSFENNYLLRGVIHVLDQKGFLPIRA